MPHNHEFTNTENLTTHYATKDCTNNGEMTAELSQCASSQSRALGTEQYMEYYDHKSSACPNNQEQGRSVELCIFVLH